MEGKFYYKSNYYFPLTLISALCIVILPCVAAITCNSTALGLITAAVTVVCFLVLVYAAARVPCWFTAGRDEVTIQKLFRKTVIRYEDIKDIEVSNEFINTLMLREGPYHLEHIVFLTKNGRISFTSKTRAVMMEDGRPMPFEDGLFEQLRMYITKQVRTGEL